MGIESRFCPPVQTSYTMGTRYFLGIKRPGRGRNHPPHPAKRMKKEYSYTYPSSSGPARPVRKWNLLYLNTQVTIRYPFSNPKYLCFRKHRNLENMERGIKMDRPLVT
jgi:hypothetical protein